jgi:hypothetical protein
MPFFFTFSRLFSPLPILNVCSVTRSLSLPVRRRVYLEKSGDTDHLLQIVEHLRPLLSMFYKTTGSDSFLFG